MPKSVQRICWFAVAEHVFPLSEMGSAGKEYLEECASASICANTDTFPHHGLSGYQLSALLWIPVFL